MGFFLKLVLALSSLAAFGQASPTLASTTQTLSLPLSGVAEPTSLTSPVSKKVPINLPGAKFANSPWYVFEMMCPNWELAQGSLPGLPVGWILRGYCLDNNGTHTWSNWHNIDTCIDITQAGVFEHHYDSGNLTSHCIDCNAGIHDTYLHPVDNENGPTKLLCTCNATDTSDHWDTAPAAIMPGKFLLGLDYGQIWCQPTSYDQYPSVPDPVTIASDPALHDDPPPGPDRRLAQHNNIPEFSTLVKKAQSAYPIGSSYTESCHADFKLTGDEPGPTWPLRPRIMWAECANNLGQWANSSLDIGLCFGTNEGKLIPHPDGLFNTSCWNCVSQYDAPEPTLLCHCYNKQRPDVPGANITATTVTISPTVQVLNGTLTCFDFVGTRGDIPPAGIEHHAGTSKRASKGHHNSSEPDISTGLVRRDEVNKTIAVGYSKTCYYISVTKSDPVLIALCRETPSVQSSLIWNSLDLNSCFAYGGQKIASGRGLNEDGCRDCVLDGSKLQCACTSKQNQTMEYPQFDTEEYITNVNGNLCCPGTGVCAKASANPPAALQQLQPPPEGRPGYPDGSQPNYPQSGYGRPAVTSA